MSERVDTVFTDDTVRGRRWVKLAPVLVVLVLVVGAAIALSRPVPGRRATTDDSASVVISDARPVEAAVYPITLQEGGDPAHEADHVFAALMGVEGIASAELSWSSKLSLTVRYDPELISGQEIASIVMSTGYVAPPAP